MITVAIYIKDVQTGQYNRVDLFDDEKISVVSSIQNINDISKTFTDFSQTFTVPASKQNNKIFRHWYDNTNDEPFSTLVKADAYIEIDTITFRRGKIQLESANVEDGQAKDYSITFIGLLGNLKDTFAGLYLKDLTSTTYDFVYTATYVGNKIFSDVVSDNIMFPLITSNNVWEYGFGYNIGNASGIYPIRYNELFPALRLRAVLNMIEQRFGINFDGTTEDPSTFLTDPRFTNAYLWLKNAETFETKETLTSVNFNSKGGTATETGYFVDLSEDRVNSTQPPSYVLSGTGFTYNFHHKQLTFKVTPLVTGISYKIYVYKNGDQLIYTSNALVSQNNVPFTTPILDYKQNRVPTNDYFTFYIGTYEPFTFKTEVNATAEYRYNLSPSNPEIRNSYGASSSQTTPSYTLQVRQYMPEIKIEDFFSGILKMFNLTCFSNDGINYTLNTIDNYYDDGSDVDITKYVIQDKKTLNRVKTHKKINFDYEKSESRINVAFESNAGIPYGSLHYSNTPPAEGEEYSIKLPFEDLNFNNIGGGLLQVGYALNTDFQKYIPKPIILYDYNPNGLTSIPTIYFSTANSGSGFPQNSYKAFGQETLISGETYGLNFNEQQSTLTNTPVENGLYQTYYSNYFANIFNFKARLTKISAILPTSILTSLKLNDTILIRDTKYLINTMTTDLTSGVAQFELLTDQRVVPDTSIVLNLDAGNPESYSGTGTLWNDLSTYNNDGTLINGPTFTSTNGGGIVFDGTDDYVSISDNTTLRPTVFTLDVWIKPTSFTNINSTVIVKPYNGPTWTSPFLSYMIRINNYGTILQCSTNNGTFCPLNVNYSFSTGTIYNIVYTYDSSTGVAIAYLNGNQIGTTTFSPGNILYSAFPVVLGSSGGYVSTGGKSDEEFLGNIYNVNTYNRFLSSTEILEKFNETKSRYGL
jgi:hypothetical protein